MLQFAVTSLYKSTDWTTRRRLFVRDACLLAIDDFRLLFVLVSYYIFFVLGHLLIKIKLPGALFSCCAKEEVYKCFS